MTTRQDLVNVKSKAMRNRIWFRTLSTIERAIVNLTIKCVETIRSPTLQTVLSNIIYKTLESLKNQFPSKAEKIGRRLAEKLGTLAQKWGNKNASNWKRDRDYIMYLGVNSVNLEGQYYG